jgi:lipopolysaccharide biosynthesis protein
MIIAKKNKRLGIYYFSDKDGIFDGAHELLVSKMMPFLDKLIFVYSGKLTDDSKIKIHKYTDTLLHLKKGFKQNAYKLGYFSANVDAFSEVLFFDNSFLGPFYDLSDMFDEMNSRDIDFWGLDFCYPHMTTQTENNTFGLKKSKMLFKYIDQSFFAVRSSLFNIPLFNSYLSKIGTAKRKGRLNYKTSVIATELFTKSGFTAGGYLDTNQLKKYSYNLMQDTPYIAVSQKKSPLLYSKTFHRDLSETLEYTLGQDTLKTCDFIDESTDYDINLLYDHILRVGNQHDIKNALGLTYSLPRDYDIPQKSKSNESVALCMHLYYEDLFDYCLNYAKSMPSNSHVFITTNNDAKKAEIERVFSELNCEKLEVRVIGNRGRDVSSLLIGIKDVLNDYDIICFAHDKKTSQFSPYIVGETFSYQCFENILASTHFVNNVIETFKANPRLGTLSPTIPFHGPMFSSMGRDWTLNYENTIALAKKHSITVDISEDKPPVSPLGTMFWLRGKALLSLCDDDMAYDDFPPEPNNTNGTVLHAYERLYPYAAQQAGYFAGQVMVDSYATLQTHAHYHMLRKLGYQLFSEFDLQCDNFNSMMYYLKTTVDYIPKQSVYNRIKLYLYLNLDAKVVAKIKKIKSIFKRNKQ